MKNNRLGKSNLFVSEVSLGCMSLLRNVSSAAEVIKSAIDCGINFFDTADIYDEGENEKLLSRTISSKVRSEILISTKGGHQWDFTNGKWFWNPNPDHIKKAVTASLQRLGTDYIDLYHVHGGTIEDPIEDLILTLDRLVESGKIRYYGISSIRPNVVRQYVEKSSIVSVMLQYSIIDRRPEEELLGLLFDTSVGVIARGSLAKGVLVAKQVNNYLDYSATDLCKIRAALELVSSKERSKAQTAMKFVLSSDRVTSVLSGCRTLAQLKENIATSYARSLSLDEIEIINKVLSKQIYRQHR